MFLKFSGLGTTLKFRFIILDTLKRYASSTSLEVTSIIYSNQVIDNL